MRTPTARAHGMEELQILVDAHQQYAYRFHTQQASTLPRALPAPVASSVRTSAFLASAIATSREHAVGGGDDDHKAAKLIRLDPGPP